MKTFSWTRAKLKMRAALTVLTLILVVSFQNCGGGFAPKDLAASSFSSETPTQFPAPDVVDVDYTGKAPGNFQTTNKAIPNAPAATVMRWDLGADVSFGSRFNGASFSVEVLKFTPADGSTPVYFVTKPTLTAGSQALDIEDLRVGVGGERNDVSTTFQGLRTTVAANSTVVLSTATLLHEIDADSPNQDQLSLHFKRLWPNGVALPTEPTATPIPTLNGASLYAKHCASCHGVLANSTKRDRTSQQIVNSFTTAPSMSFLATVLSQAEVDAIAAALK